MSSPEEGEEKDPTQFPKMTREMHKVILQSLSMKSTGIIIEEYGIPISKEDLDTLYHWLNDEVINFYLNMIMARSKENENLPNVHAFNTFFYDSFSTGGYANVKSRTRKIDLFSKDILFVPINYKDPRNEHWALAVIRLKKDSVYGPGVYYYDSLGRENTKVLKDLLNYLESEHMDKKKKLLDTSDFKLENVKNIPKQRNGSDCGVYALKYAEYLSRNASITFTEKDISYFRQTMVFEIVKNNIINYSNTGCEVFKRGIQNWKVSKKLLICSHLPIPPILKVRYFVLVC